MKATIITNPKKQELLAHIAHKLNSIPPSKELLLYYLLAKSIDQECQPAIEDCVKALAIIRDDETFEKIISWIQYNIKLEDEIKMASLVQKAHLN